MELLDTMKWQKEHKTWSQNDMNSTNINLATLRRLFTLFALNFLKWICQYYPNKDYINLRLSSFQTAKPDTRVRY